MTDDSQRVAPADPARRSERLARLHEDLKASAVVALAFIALGLFLEPTRFGQWLQRLTYYELHARFPGDCKDVVIADITDIPLRSRDPESDAVTHRPTLIEVLKAILEQDPSTVALDIDLSPGLEGWMDDDDQELLDLCEEHGVFVGVERQCDRAAAEWLGSADYAPLATTVKADRGDNRLMPRSYGKTGSEGALPGLGWKLAGSFLDEPIGLPNNLLYSAIVYAEHEGMRDEFLVDFSPIDRLAEDRIPAGSALEVRRLARVASPITKRAVIVGRADPNRMMENSFVPPGHNTAYPGVYSHACAANTLIRGPLVQPTPLGRVLLDVLAAVLMFGLVFGVRFLALDSPSDLRLRRAHALASVIASAAVVMAAVYVARHWRFVWDGYPFVVAALLLHPFGERVVHALPGIVQRSLFERGMAPAVAVRWRRPAIALLIVIAAGIVWNMLAHEPPQTSGPVEAASPAASTVQLVQPVGTRMLFATKQDPREFAYLYDPGSALRRVEGYQALKAELYVGSGRIMPLREFDREGDIMFAKAANLGVLSRPRSLLAHLADVATPEGVARSLEGVRLLLSESNHLSRQKSLEDENVFAGLKLLKTLPAAVARMNEIDELLARTGDVLVWPERLDEVAQRIEAESVAILDRARLTVWHPLRQTDPEGSWIAVDGLSDRSVLYLDDDAPVEFTVVRSDEVTVVERRTESSLALSRAMGTPVFVRISSLLGDDNHVALATLHVESLPSAGEKGTACAILPERTYAGALSTEQPEAWVRFEPSAGTTYIMETAHLADADTVLSLFSSDPEPLATNDDGGRGWASRIEWTASSSDVYWLKVSAVGSRHGNFELSITKE